MRIYIHSREEWKIAPVFMGELLPFSITVCEDFLQILIWESGHGL
jgi:hypothetical protein